MAELIHECEYRVRDAAGESYRARVYGEPRGHLWSGWIEFSSDSGEVRRTAQETSQPNRDGLAYWASGLEPVYLDGAFNRAR